MGKNDNIFSIAGDRPSKPKVVPARAASPQPAPVAKRALPSIDDPVLEAALRKMQEMHDQLEAKIEMVYRRMGLNKETLKRTLDNASTYDRLQITYEWSQNQRRILRDQIGNMFGAKALEALESKRTKKELDRHKKKSLGARKNWLNMH